MSKGIKVESLSGVLSLIYSAVMNTNCTDTAKLLRNLDLVGVRQEAMIFGQKNENL